MLKSIRFPTYPPTHSPNVMIWNNAGCSYQINYQSRINYPSRVLITLSVWNAVGMAPGLYIYDLFELFATHKRICTMFLFISSVFGSYISICTSTYTVQCIPHVAICTDFLYIHVLIASMHILSTYFLDYCYLECSNFPKVQNMYIFVKQNLKIFLFSVQPLLTY